MVFLLDKLDQLNLSGFVLIAMAAELGVKKVKQRLARAERRIQKTERRVESLAKEIKRLKSKMKKI